MLYVTNKYSTKHVSGLYRRELIRFLNKNLLHSIFVSLSKTQLNAILQRRAGDSALETEALLREL